MGNFKLWKISCKTVLAKNTLFLENNTIVCIYCSYLWTCRATASGSRWGSVRLKVVAWIKGRERVVKREKMRMQVKESILILIDANEQANNNGAADMLLVWSLFTETQIEGYNVIICVFFVNLA